MDMYRAFLAIIISFVILIGYQYFFVAPSMNNAVPQGQDVSQQAPVSPQVTPDEKQQATPVPIQPLPMQETSAVIDTAARDISIETPLYSAVINEQGGGFKSFVLKDYQKELDGDTGSMELVQTELPTELPIIFSLQSGTAQGVPLFKADKEKIVLTEGGEKATLMMTASMGGGVEIIRTLVFDPATYLIDDRYQVTNSSSASVAAAPAMVLTNRPFSIENAASRFMFSGPVAFVNGELSEVKGKKLTQGPQIFQGAVSWAAYEDNYFICAVIPMGDLNRSVQMSAVDETVRSVISNETTTLEPNASQVFEYNLYFGPKKLSILKQVGHNLSRAINFGWFDVLAKPMLWLLNFFYDYIRNYGVAIILLTVLIKGAFWPITQKGMKSMKNMQKLQPKVAKLKEKFKDDPQKMNQEMMALYKTYKVNPLGGCLPLVLQIPFFFALYKVLLMSIELRHAPFMLWINDLSAPDRLWIGFDIPFLHGIPVLTLLMGGSMYLQQKMTPTTADPTQARIMQMLPIIFTFMFLNFASGLVLYWFVNNLLSILQQQLINRQTKS